MHERHCGGELPPGRRGGRVVRRAHDRDDGRPTAGAAWHRVSADDRPTRAVRAVSPLVPRRRRAGRGRPARLATPGAAGVLDGGDRTGPPQPAVP